MNHAPAFAVGGPFLEAEGFSTARQILLQADGRIVVIGVGPQFDFGLTRYDASGILDTTFGNAGRVTTDFIGTDDVAQAVARQPDGRIVVVGFTVGAQRTDLAVARYNADGSLDSTFSGDGKLMLDAIADEPDFGSGAAVQPDGKILITAGGYSQNAIVRLNADGTLDTTFGGGDGVVLYSGASGTPVVLQPDGKIVTLGYDSQDFQVYRFNANGTPDSTFDADGRAIGNFGGSDTAMAFALQGDGRIVVAGTGGATSNSPDFAVARFNANGSLDTTFSGDGRLTLDVGGYDRVWGTAIQSDGKIVLAGDTFYPGASDGDIIIARLNANGTLDTTFGGDGTVGIEFDLSPEWVFDVKVQADVGILIVGQLATSSGNRWMVARLNADGSPDLAFHAVNTLDAAPAYTEGGSPVVLDGDVRVFDADLAATGHYGGATLTLARRGGASAQDVFSATGSLGALVQGSALVYGGVTVGLVSTNSGGVLSLAFNSSATQWRVDGVLSALAYSNGSSTPPDTVQIDWLFSDGNTGAQGTGGPLTTVGSITVTITDVVEGTAGPDTLFGDGGANIMRGRGGDDTLLARAGDDVLDGGDGNDRLEGGAGADALNGGNGFDYARYSTSVTADLQTPSHNTGEAVGDTYLAIEGVIGSALGDALYGDANVNDLVGLDGDDALFGRDGHDNLQGGNGDDTLEGGEGADRLVGGNGMDTAAYRSAPAGVTASLSDPTVNTGLAYGDRYIAVEHLVGSGFNDQLFGDGGGNTIAGENGVDYIFGLAGNDTLDGGDNNDFLEGGQGRDALNGGPGFDYARYSRATLGVSVDLIDPALNNREAEGDTYLSIEGVIGSGLADNLAGDDAANDLAGMDGIDFVIGRGGNDNLNGGAGNDRLNGGAGADRLTGGTGDDVFILRRGEANADTVGDFVGNGAAAGDQLLFQNYGLAANGATFVQLDATHWQINSADSLVHDVVVFANAPTFDVLDYSFA